MNKMVLLSLQLKCPKYRDSHGENISVDVFHLLKYELTLIGEAH